MPEYKPLTHEQRHSVERAPTPKWDAWQNLYAFLGPHDLESDLKMLHQEMCCMIDDQVRFPHPNDTPESRAQYIEKCVEFQPLISAAETYIRNLRERADRFEQKLNEIQTLLA